VTPPALTSLPDAVARVVVLEAQVAALTSALARLEAQVQANTARLAAGDVVVGQLVPQSAERVHTRDL
jgi:uncharacterized small protein (DUF1192 family)